MPAKSGVNHHLAKLDPDKVREARNRHAEGNITILELAFDYGVSLSTMTLAIRGKTWAHVKDDDVARNIAANDNEAWRAVLVFKRRDNQELVYFYEGVYGRAGTAKARVSFWMNNQTKWIADGPAWDKNTHRTVADYYDGWIEKADITWNKVKD